MQEARVDRGGTHACIAKGQTTAPAALARSAPATAKRSHRSFSGCPLCPRTQTISTRWISSKCREDLPEVGVQGGGFVCFPPAILPPLDRPTLFDRVADILRIAAKRDGAGFFQALQRADHRHQLHAVVGGVRVAPADFFFYAVEAQDSPPSAGAGIALAGAVRKDFYVFHSFRPLFPLMRLIAYPYKLFRVPST